VLNSIYEPTNNSITIHTLNIVLTAHFIALGKLLQPSETSILYAKPLTLILIYSN